MAAALVDVVFGLEEGEMETVLLPMVAIGGGLFSVVCAGMDYDFFMENYKARTLVAILGRDGARVFYGLLGVVLMVAGVYMMVVGA